MVNQIGNSKLVIKFSVEKLQEVLTYSSIPRFLVHLPDYFPVFAEKNNFNIIELEIMMKIEIKPEIIRIDEDMEVSRLTLEIVISMVNGDRKLKFFNTYSAENYKIECLLKALMESCNCSFFDRLHASRRISNRYVNMIDMIKIR